MTEGDKGILPNSKTSRTKKRNKTRSNDWGRGRKTGKEGAQIQQEKGNPERVSMAAGRRRPELVDPNWKKTLVPIAIDIGLKTKKFFQRRTATGELRRTVNLSGPALSSAL